MDGRGGDTIAAHSTGRPPAAVAIIRVSGPDAHAVGIALGGELPEPRCVALRSLRHPASGDPLDSALVLRFDAPHSATGENIVEFQCHGGRAVVAAVLDALTSCHQIRLAEPGEFTRRALGNGRIDLTEAEGLADLLEAETEAQRRAALALASGALSRKIDEWQAAVIALSAQAEAAIDYVGDDDETATDTGALCAASVRLADELDRWLAQPRAERLKDGIRVVVAGPVNAGKSSLINAIAGFERSIVTAVAGTTRDSIEVPLTIDGLPLLFVDTAGLRESTDPVERIGIARAGDELERADILLWLGDRGDAPSHPGLVVIHAKADLGPTIDAHDLAVSARTGCGVSELVQRVTREAGALLPPADQIALNQRHAKVISEAAKLLGSPPTDLVLLAETFRAARGCFDRVTGRAGVEDAIDAIFARFCLGK